MRPLGMSALTVAALALLGSTAWAQRPVGLGGLGGGPFLLLVPNVQEELKLNGDQTRTLPQTIQQIMGKYRDEMVGLRDLPPEERSKKQRALTRAMNDEAKKALMLSADQSKRFDQISLQQRGIEVFSDPEVGARLMLTEDQVSKITNIAADARERFQEIAQGAGNDREEAMRKIRQLQKELMTKAQAELTDEQRDAWKKLTGDPFEVRFEQRG